MDCMVIPVIAALAASGLQVSHADQPSAPRGQISLALIDSSGEIVAESARHCSALSGCAAPILIGRAGLDRVRLVVRPDGGAGMHVHPVIEDERGRELDLSPMRLCWRTAGMARGELSLKPLRAPEETRGLRLPRPAFDEAAETVTLAIAITPGL